MKTTAYIIPALCFFATNFFAINSFAQNSTKQINDTHIYENVRPLQELNTENIGEAYPCISGDGLQLYFVKGTNTADSIMFTSRTSLDTPFDKAIPLALNLPHLVSCTGIWLSPDELDFYICNRETIFHTHRNRRNEAFSNGFEEIKIEGLGKTAIMAISFDATQRQLFLNAATADGTEIRTYKRETPTSFVYDYKIGTNIRTSYLSKNGLSLFCSENGDQEKTNFVALTRTSINDKFDAANAQKLEGLSANKRNSHLTMSDNLDCVVFTSSKENFWTQNDLYIARLEKPTPEMPQTVAATSATASVPLGSNAVVVYPNPSTGIFHFANTEKQTNDATTTVELNIYNTLGETIVYNPRFVLGDDASINLYNQAKGVYFCRIMDAKRQVSVHRIVLE